MSIVNAEKGKDIKESVGWVVSAYVFRRLPARNYSSTEDLVVHPFLRLTDATPYLVLRLPCSTKAAQQQAYPGT